jgi:N-acetyl-gamma-glutamyl-phosphate reductase
MATRVAIIGPTGYTGLYLVQLLLRHPHASITYLASHRQELPNIADEFPQLLGRCEMVCRPIDAAVMAKEADVAFSCLPHVASMQHVPALLEAGLKVIDLSADYRLSSPELYEKVYGHAHSDRKHLPEAVYGLPELFARDIPGAKLVANPGCYPTAAALGIAPLLSRSLVKPDGILINAASGVSGAGRQPKPNLHFPEVNESYAAYNPGSHRHEPEISQTLSRVRGGPTRVLFVPHLLPVDCGILATIYLDPLDDDVTQDDLFEAFYDAYAECPFVRVRKDLPNVKWVRGTNYCDLSVRLVGPSTGADGGLLPGASGEARKIIVFAAIDNMIKGASGQAVQNMNLMFGHEPAAGLL